MGAGQSEMIGNLTVMDGKSFKSNWKVIGAGGFGQVFKARHKKMGKDVAVKIVGRDNGCSDEDFVHQAKVMLRAQSPYVVNVLGVFRGCTPRGPLILVGVVMDLMERGSLWSLQRKRKSQPLPWPLVLRLVHQVAEGMKYLHSLTPALIHKDLQPDNILLDKDLNVKIGGFGLAKFANTVTDPRLQGFRAAFYAPPESEQGGATPAYDVYSYAVLVWTILNPAYVIARGEESYPVRPSLEDVRRMGVPGLEELVELMERCWNQDPHQRPTSTECTAVTERLYEQHGWSGIDDAVRRVQLEQDGVQQDGPDPDQDQPAPDPKRENNDFIPNLKVMMDEKNWKAMDGNSFEGNWKVIGAGGFGQVYKARHCQWGKDVAVKLLFKDDGSSSEEDLVREAKLILRAESPYVVKVLGVFSGCTPNSPITTVGLVMDLMDSGSLESLQKKRKHQPLPWPLVFRLAHQVAEGMNDLHCLTPEPLIHKDLKPGNILLDSDLNVKVTDFGLAKFAKSLTTKPLEGVCTAFYSPPEAKQGGATCAYDVYSYAIVVWSILNPAYVIARGEESYPVRPSLENVRRMKAPGLEELVDLMVKCWNKYRYKRPTFAECTAVTGRLYEKHMRGIEDAVHQVQRELEKTM